MSGGIRSVGSLWPAPLSFADWCGGKSSFEEHVDWSGAYIAYVGAYASRGGTADDAVQDGRDSVVFRRVVDKRGRSGKCFGGDGSVSTSGVARKYAIRFGSFDPELCEEVGVAVGEGSDDRRVGREFCAGSESGLDVGDAARAVPDSVLADGGVVKKSPVDVCGGVVRGKHYESNRRKRLSRKKRNASSRVDVGSVEDWRNSGGVSSVGEADQNVPTLREFVESRVDSEMLDERCVDLEERIADEVAAKSAKRTLNEKWAMENKLAAAKAKRALEILEAQDLQAEIKKQATYLRLQTEKNMVGMEKAHQFLKRTGNVPGFAQTVLSDEGLTDGSSASPVSPGECTISPDSSASMKEFRELAKKCADQQDKLDKFHKMTKIHPDYIDLYKKQTWTINSENIRILDEMYPQGHALNPIPDYENYDAPTHGELIVGSDEEYFPY